MYYLGINQIKYANNCFNFIQVTRKYKSVVINEPNFLYQDASRSDNIEYCSKLKTIRFPSFNQFVPILFYLFIKFLVHWRFAVCFVMLSRWWSITYWTVSKLRRRSGHITYIKLRELDNWQRTGAVHSDCRQPSTNWIKWTTKDAGNKDSITW